MSLGGSTLAKPLCHSLDRPARKLRAFCRHLHAPKVLVRGYAGRMANVGTPVAVFGKSHISFGHPRPSGRRPGRFRGCVSETAVARRGGHRKVGFRKGPVHWLSWFSARSFILATRYNGRGPTWTSVGIYGLRWAAEMTGARIQARHECGRRNGMSGSWMGA